MNKAKQNCQTPGPLGVLKSNLVSLAFGVEVAEVNGPNRADKTEEKQANRRLLAASYNLLDRAGRELGIDAAELAKGLDLAALIRAAQDLRRMVENVLTDSQLDAPQLGGARAKCATTIRAALGPLDSALAKVPAPRA
jgi:hypothetical protein